ncbi:hypothetical protein DIJ64_01555 [Mycobacterium leprae]|uniref:Uncharacterized protein n=1 Tax=Mycobacterium leprae TaxID=1769 RepID=A0AAD0KSQ8_MYCLR|nr:hypothetical protein DIJ64_01555 [Mycobacterium leprae]OAR20062.1 hypothetical protein A8144_12450 [Mycobacterium leprae 3125609]OAX70407.1 hypothetical protein A3216_12110 [Mycobacterium leprae 7935681]
MCQLQEVCEFYFVDRIAILLLAVILGELLGLPDDARDRSLARANSTMHPARAAASMRHVS